ncbi:MAG: dUTP diphosphatase [Ignavibacteriae bacterium]|nr:MAG: dUTP diphosphatase [Ignavibacteriota bacterium]
MTESLPVRILRLQPEKTDIPLPAYATVGSAGMDICAAVDQDTEIQPGETALIPSGFVIELPQGVEAQIRPRSGLAVKHSIGIMNSPGTIDSDYRGEVKIILTNFGKKPFMVHRGDRIAQMVVSIYERVLWTETSTLADSVRGEGGFGHTGVLSKGSS